MEAVDKSMIKALLPPTSEEQQTPSLCRAISPIGNSENFPGDKVLLIEVKYRDKKNEEIETFNNEEFLFPFLVAAMDCPVHISQNCILHLSSLSSQPILA